MATTRSGGPAGRSKKQGTKPAPRAAAKPARAVPASRILKVGGGTKLQRLEAALRSPEGATITALSKDLAWQAHSVRGAISGALKKKRGLTINSTIVQGGERIYRIVG